MSNLYQKITFICLLCLVAVLYSSCRYPYNTPQAKSFRKAQKAEKKLQNSLSQKEKNNTVDSTVVALDSITNDSIRTISKTDKMGGDKSIVKDSTSQDSTLVNAIVNDSTIVDSTLIEKDTALVQSAVFSKDSLQSPVNYSAKDSMIYDLVNKKVFLYGDAKVTYGTYNIDAAYIILDMANSTATAEGFIDSSGRERGRPKFKDGTQEFESTKIVYNFKSGKGKVYETTTKQLDGYFVSESTKFVSNKSEGEDETTLYSENCLFTTCDRRHAHFGIRTTKAKIVPNKVAVLGPSYLEIMGLPTPIILPFAFFPMKKKPDQRSGFIFSTNLEFSQAFGPGIRGVGYYWALSDYVDLALTTDLYMRGSFRLNAVANYNKKYKYKGSFALGYSRLKFDAIPNDEIRQDFNVRWEYTQDNKAHPSQSFNASVNFGTSDFYRNTTNAASQVLQGQFNSNISYTKRFVGTPFTLALSASHTQSVQTRIMTITAPKVDLRMNQIFPFKRKKAVGLPRWYENVAVGYNMNFQNRGSIVDSVLFAPNGLQKFIDTMEYQVVHKPTVTMNFKLFKLINIQPNIQYSEYWFFKSLDRRFDPNLVVNETPIIGSQGDTTGIRRDTLFGQVITEENKGFYAVRDLSAGISANTQIFAFNNFSIGRLHRMMALFRPDVGFKWRPDYQDDFWGYYNNIQTDTRYPDRYNKYSRFTYAPSGGKSSLLTYGLSGRVEGKWRKSTVDTTGEKYQNIVLINNWTINGDYNMAVDSFRWSTVNMGANTIILKKINVQWAATFDPYTADIETNQRVNITEWAANKRLLRLTSNRINVSSTFTGNDLRTWFTSKEKRKNQLELTEQQKRSAPKKEFLQSLSINYNLSMSKYFANGKDTTAFTTNEINIAGIFNLSQSWAFRIGRVGYDITRQRITYPDFTLTRDLHCWEMGINWQPAPERRTWAFYLRVKPSSLGFINVPARKTVFDVL